MASQFMANRRELQQQARISAQVAGTNMSLTRTPTWAKRPRLLSPAPMFRLPTRHSWRTVRPLASHTSVPADVLPEHLLEARGLRIRRDESGGLASDASLFEIVADFERRTILEKLEACDWSQTATAEAFRVPLSTLNQKIKRLNIDVRKRGGQ